MFVNEVVEEIQEKLPNYLSPQSLLRKITQVRDRLLRNFTGAQQQSEVVCSAIDLLKGVDQYPLPASAGAITEVTLKCHPHEYYDSGGYWDDYDREYVRIGMKQFDQREGYRPYYYFAAGMIGISRTPKEDVPYGLKIFHSPVLLPLGILDLQGNTNTGFDPNFDMLLVYGVLKDITEGAQASEMQAKYQELYNEYVTANTGYEKYRVKENW